MTNDIVERLRATKKIAPAYSAAVVRSTGPKTPPASRSVAHEYPKALVNPDGPEAAAEIERLRRELAERDARIAAWLRNQWDGRLQSAVYLADAIEAGAYRGEGE